MLIVSFQIHTPKKKQENTLTIIISLKTIIILSFLHLICFWWEGATKNYRRTYLELGSGIPGKKDMLIFNVFMYQEISAVL